MLSCESLCDSEGVGCRAAASTARERVATQGRRGGSLLGIDTGKTSVRVGVFRSDFTLLERWSTSSADVSSAQSAIRAHLQLLQAKYEIENAGISIFGPLEGDPGSKDYGALIESSGQHGSVAEEDGGSGGEDVPAAG